MPWLLCVLVGAAWLAAPALAVAQTGGGNDPLRQAAREHYQRARSLLEEGDAVTALSEFAASYQLFPNWPSLYGMAMCQEALGRPATALELYRQVLREFGDGVPESERVAIGQRIIELQALVGEQPVPAPAMGRLSVRSVPPGAAVRVDGSDAGTTPLQMEVSVGRHRVEVHLDGHESATRWVDIREGQTTTIEVELAALEDRPVETGALVIRVDPGGTVFLDGESLGSAPIGPHPVAPGRYLVRVVGDDGRSWEETVEVAAGRTMVVDVRLGEPPGVEPLWFWLAAGTAGALAVGGAATGGYVLWLEDKYYRSTSQTEIDDIKAVGDPLRIVTDALFGAAGALAIGAITLLFFTNFSGEGGISADVGPLDPSVPEAAWAFTREW